MSAEGWPCHRIVSGHYSNSTSSNSEIVAGAEFVWWFRVFPQDGGSAIYYLIHASKHIGLSVS